MVIPLLAGAAAALMAALVLTPLLRRLAHRLDITDRPAGLLKPHEKPIAYLGGPAFYLAWLAGIGVAWATAEASGIALPVRLAWAAAGLALLPLGAGLADDIRELPPRLRVLLEVSAACLMWWLGIRWVAIPGLDPGSWMMLPIGLGLQIALVLGACNAVNLLDGLDGLCGGVTAVAMLGLGTLAGGALMFRDWPGLDGRLQAVALVAPLLAAALVGFLVYNYKPASIFMGDAGSLALGFAVAACGALLCGPGVAGLHLGLSGMVIVAVPIGDTALAFYRRIKLKRPLFEGDRSHFYDQLVDRGLSVRSAVNLCYAVGAAYAAIGVVGGVLLPFWGALLLYAAVGVASGVALRQLGFTRLSPAEAEG